MSKWAISKDRDGKYAGKWTLLFPDRKTVAVHDTFNQAIATMLDARIWDAGLQIKRAQRQIEQMTMLRRRLT